MAIKQISGGAFQYPDGSKVAAGTLVLRLSQDATVSGTGQVAPAEIAITLDSNGNANEYLWFNDSLSPSGTVYQATLFDASGRRVWGPENWSLTGSSPLDISTLVPSSNSVSYSGAILTDPAGDQTINSGTLSVTDGILADVIGNINAITGNNIRYADQFPGADIGAKIQAAHDDLPSVGGWIDARAIDDVQTWSTTANLSKPCILLLGMGTFTYTGTTQAINASSNNVYIKGSGRGSTVLKYAGASTIDLIKFRNGNSGIAYVGVYDLNTRFDTGAKASGSTQIHLYDVVSFEMNNLYLSVDGTAGTMINRGIIVENVNTGLVPPRGNGRIANITHSNTHDGSAASGAIAIYLKGTAGQALQQIALEGEADLESSWVGLQCEYTSQSTLAGAWYISGNNTNIKLVSCVGWVFIAPNLNFAITENFNIDSGCTDTVIMNPVYQTTLTLGTDNGTRTSNLNSRGSSWKIGTTASVTDKIQLDSTVGQITAKGTVVLNSNSISAPTTYAQLTGTFTGARVITFPDQSIGITGTAGATKQKSESAADTSVLTVTPPAVAGQYRISFSAAVSAQTSATLGWTATWKDSNGSAQAPTNLSLLKSGTAAPALTFVAATNDNYSGSMIVDVDNSATAIVVKLTFSGTSFTAKVSAAIERIQ